MSQGIATMGYVTRYYLSIVGVDGIDAKDEKAVRHSHHPDYDAWIKWIECEWSHEAKVGQPSIVMDIPVGWLYDFWLQKSDRCKWYGHEIDMKTLSRHFPTLVFMLKGEGEEAQDLWIKYFKNGKMQACPAKITYDDYDPSELADEKPQ